MLALLSTLGRLVGVLALGAALGSGSTPAVVSLSHAGPPPTGAVGRDVGDSSCAGTLPSTVEFGVIATTAGRPYYESPCLAAEYTWASGLTYRPQYYVNLADPGHKSAHWGRGGPRTCHGGPKYDAGCAYDYGFEATRAAWAYVQSVGASGEGRWWLDVEIDNTWGYTSSGVAANIALIHGALDQLRTHAHVNAGIYTETTWWTYITRATTSFSHTPVWGGGANSKRHARSNCRAHSITGGPALLAQWIAAGVDHDVAC